MARYFEMIKSLKNEQEWDKIISLGEKSLCQATQEQQFEIIDQLISTHFRIGNFEKAKECAESLLALADQSNRPELVANSLYKFSAALRGEAGSAEKEKQRYLYKEARLFAQKALDICNSQLHEHILLKAKTLFNAGAAECDDPEGSTSKGIPLYEEALKLFATSNEEDYRQRTSIRLAKAYLLQGDIKRSWQIVEEFNSLQPDKRTYMHLCYLKAQLLMAKNHSTEATQIIEEGKQIAHQLNAKADLHRFEALVR